MKVHVDTVEEGELGKKYHAIVFVVSPSVHALVLPFLFPADACSTEPRYGRGRVSFASYKYIEIR